MAHSKKQSKGGGPRASTGGQGASAGTLEPGRRVGDTVLVELAPGEPAVYAVIVASVPSASGGRATEVRWQGSHLAVGAQGRARVTRYFASGQPGP